MNSQQKFKVSLHFKDTWTDSKTGNLYNSEYSTETFYADTEEELNEIISERASDLSPVVNAGVIFEREYIDHDKYTDTPKEKLTKEEMFDFILDNSVNINVSNTMWQKTDSTKVRIKYDVSINDTKMCGMDLEEAIQYYHNNVRGRK